MMKRMLILVFSTLLFCSCGLMFDFFGTVSASMEISTDYFWGILDGNLVWEIAPIEQSGSEWMLKVHDVSNPLCPEEKSRIACENVDNAVFADNLLYCIRKNIDIDANYTIQIQIFNLSDPTSPAEIPTVVPAAITLPQSYGDGFFNTINYNNGFLFFDYNDLIKIINVSNLSNITETSSISILQPEDIYGDGDLLWVLNDFGLTVFDISNKNNPVVLSRLPGPDAGAFERTMAVNDDSVYISNWNIHDVAVFDISSGTDPRLIGYINAFNEDEQVAGMGIYNGYLYTVSGVANQSNLYSIDKYNLNNFTSPEAHYNTFIYNPGDKLKLYFTEKYLITASIAYSIY